jgi:hypothetical protein
MPRYSDKYLDALFDSSEYPDVVMLQGILARHFLIRHCQSTGFRLTSSWQ